MTDGHDDVFALNAASGTQKWAYKPTQIPGEMPALDQVFVCCGRNNRGVVFILHRQRVWRDWPDRQFAPNPVGDAIVAFALP